MSFRKFLPSRLLTIYRSIMSGSIVKGKVVDDEGLLSLKSLIMEAQAQGDDERTIQKTVQFLYRQNTSSFYKFLIKNKLAFLVLWTESKCMVRHFGLQGLVYIRWNDDEYVYDVFLNKKYGSGGNDRGEKLGEVEVEHCAIDRIASKVLCDGLGDRKREDCGGVITWAGRLAQVTPVEPVVPVTPVEPPVEPVVPVTPVEPPVEPY